MRTLTAFSTALGRLLGRGGSLVPFMARKSSSFSLRDSVVKIRGTSGRATSFCTSAAGCCFGSGSGTAGAFPFSFSEA